MTIPASLTAKARKDPFFIAHWLDQTGLSDAELAARLECDVEQLARLGMCRHTIIEAEVEQIARHASCNAAALHDLLRR